jgi:hypothetical protein
MATYKENGNHFGRILFGIICIVLFVFAGLQAEIKHFPLFLLCYLLFDLLFAENECCTLVECNWKQRGLSE